MLRALLDRLTPALPSECAVCRAWPAPVLCEACVARFAQPRARCRSCALPVPQGVERCGACIKQEPPLDLCLAAVAYEYPWSGLIARYKFGGSPGWSQALALLMRSTPWAEPALDAADRVLPMPLSHQRLRQRGFNQALELARQLGPARVDAGLLLRLRDTPAQSALPRATRLRNVQDAFGVASGRERDIVGRRIVLIDDVMTSGASLYTAAQALHAAGAAHITALVLARTE
ncbi:MAG: phosphoribosyltransferase family protein [Hylemonella sp.]|nr:phosphoribosyltransferase family protein [Hylemonella sp.]